MAETIAKVGDSSKNSDGQISSVMQDETGEAVVPIQDSMGVKSITQGMAKINPTDNTKYTWVPNPEEVLQLFDALKKNRFLPFSWECPGRRNPYEVEKHVPEPEKATNAVKETEVEADNFDFEEESTPMMRRPVKVSQSPQPKGSAKKRTTNLAGILSNMERHRIMDQMQSGDKKSNQSQP